MGLKIQHGPKVDYTAFVWFQEEMTKHKRAQFVIHV